MGVISPKKGTICPCKSKYGTEYHVIKKLLFKKNFANNDYLARAPHKTYLGDKGQRLKDGFFIECAMSGVRDTGGYSLFIIRNPTFSFE